MKNGCRSLTPQEVTVIAAKLATQGRFGQRNRMLFLLGVHTGFRISELLSIRVKDVVQHGKLMPTVTVTKANMKGQTESRQIELTDFIRPILWTYITEQNLKTNDYIFTGQKGSHITPHQAHVILTKAFDVLQLQGKLATHCMRKTFAQTYYTASGKDLLATKEALGHAYLNTTQAYLSVDPDKHHEVMKKLSDELSA